MNRLLSICLCYLISITPLNAQNILGETELNWVGSGTIRTAPNKDIQRGKCRITTAPIPEMVGHEITGKCSSPAGASRIAIRIEDRGNNQLAGVFTTKVTNTSIQFLGTRSSNLIELSAREPQLINGTEYNSTLQITFGETDTFTLKQIVSPVDSDTHTTVVEMKFLKAN